MQDYATIPQEFRRALETAFPQLISYTAEPADPYALGFKIVHHAEDFEPVPYTEWGPEALDIAVVPPSCPNPKFPVNARALHTYMQVGKFFANWIKDRIGKFQFVDTVDYIVCLPNLASKECGVESSGRGGHNAKDYWLTNTTARMMAADVNSARGVEVIKFLVARHERLESLEKVGQPAAIDFSDPVAVCKLYLEAEEGRRRGLAVITTATVENLQGGGEVLKRLHPNRFYCGVCREVDKVCGNFRPPLFPLEA
jgi:anti-repressor protein